MTQKISEKLSIDGDGKADVAINRAGEWYKLNSLDNKFNGIVFGAAGNKPSSALNIP